jgi:hypothetical protein
VASVVVGPGPAGRKPFKVRAPPPPPPPPDGRGECFCLFFSHDNGPKRLANNSITNESGLKGHLVEIALLFRCNIYSYSTFFYVFSRRYHG